MTKEEYFYTWRAKLLDWTNRSFFLAVQLATAFESIVSFDIQIISILLYFSKSDKDVKGCCIHEKV